jgi:hypothetical protein
MEIGNYDQPPEIPAIFAAISPLVLPYVSQEMLAIACDDTSAPVPSFIHDTRIIMSGRGSNAREKLRCSLSVLINKEASPR